MFGQLKKNIGDAAKTVDEVAKTGQDVAKVVGDVTNDAKAIKNLVSPNTPATNGTAADQASSQTIRILLEVRAAKAGASDTDAGEYELHGRIFGKQMQRIADKNEPLAQQAKHKIDEIIAQALDKTAKTEVQGGKKPR